MIGGYLGALVAGYGLWLRRRDRTTLALLAIGLVFPLGYVLFWGMWVSSATTNLSGPIYYIPLYAPLTILIAAVILDVWRRQRSRGIALVAVLAVATLPFAASRFVVNRRISNAQRPWKTSVEPIKGKAMVFVWNDGPGPYLLYLNPFSSNRAKLDDRILYAVDNGAADIDLMSAQPDRAPYLQMLSVPPDYLLPNGQPRTPKVRLVPMQVLHASTVTLRARITNPRHRRTVVVALKMGDRVEYRTITTDGTNDSGVYDTEFTVAAPGAATDATALVGRLGTLQLAVGYGSTENAARRNEVVREFFPYRVDGSSLDMLLPSRKNRAKPLAKGKRKWFPETTLRELDITLASTPPRS
jgi:hypothetical protein